MTNQVRTKTKNNIENLYKSLSIQLSLDGFSFCVKNAKDNSIENFVELPFDKKLSNPEGLTSKLEELFKTNKFLQKDFSKIEAIHCNSLSVLVPDQYFDETKLNSYLDFNIKTLASDFIAFDDLQQTSAKNVYIPYVNLNNFLFQHFGSFEYKHHSTVLIDKLLSYSKGESFGFYVCINKNLFDIVVVNNNNLQFYNSFEFNTKEDFIYYILFTAEQLKLNTNEFMLSLIGNIEEESELYKIAYQYIRNIEFTNFKNAKNYSSFIVS